MIRFGRRWQLWSYDLNSGLRITSNPPFRRFWTYRNAQAERIRMNAACRKALLSYRFNVERVR